MMIMMKMSKIMIWSYLIMESIKHLQHLPAITGCISVKLLHAACGEMMLGVVVRLFNYYYKQSRPVGGPGRFCSRVRSFTFSRARHRIVLLGHHRIILRLPVPALQTLRKKICGDLLCSLSFVSYGSVKILTSNFPRGAPQQIRLEVS